MECVVVVFLALVFDHVEWLVVVDTEHIVSEAWHHEELLEHAVHVANATEISNTHIKLVVGALTSWHKVPLSWGLDILQHWSKLLLHKLEHHST